MSKESHRKKRKRKLKRRENQKKEDDKSRKEDIQTDPIDPPDFKTPIRTS